MLTKNSDEVVELRKWQLGELQWDFFGILHDALEKKLGFNRHSLGCTLIRALRSSLVSAQIQTELNRGEDSLGRAQAVGQMSP